ncbi:MAG: hypothetical protein P1P73_09340 [Brevefilum sp.]|nr:hypothetical protein [Brevefilum sp.]
MDKQPDRHRKNVRLKDYDYGSPGYYFVSIVSYERKNIFGEIIDGEMNLNQAGKIVEQSWQDIPKHFPNTSCEIFVVMPNHIHGIINIIDDEIVRARHKVSRNEDSAEPLQHAESQPMETQPLGVIVRSFKSAVTKRAHDLELFIGKKSGSGIITNISSVMRMIISRSPITSQQTPSIGDMTLKT